MFRQQSFLLKADQDQKYPNSENDNGSEQIVCFLRKNVACVNYQQQALYLEFNKLIYSYYHAHKRFFSWRESITPYRVVVSEIMLQQTQTDRVIQKFEQFIEQFPDFSSLACAPFDEVLRVWKGLGYNRRAQALQTIAQEVVARFDGILPNDPAIIETFRGIGPATAASICAFAFNRPTVFIETNIRTVFIYCFFYDQAFIEGKKRVHDKELIVLVEQMLDHNAPREWYYALMDYGVMLKKTVGNLCRLSAHYTKQSKFIGSDRQLRGQILQLLLDHKTVLVSDIPALLKKEHENERIDRVLGGLEQEQLVVLSKLTDDYKGVQDRFVVEIKK